MKQEDLITSTALVAVIIFLFKELWGLFKTKGEKQESKTDKLVEALQANTMAIQTLTIRLDHMEKRLEVVPGLEKDIAKIGQKIRDMNPDKRK